MKNILKSLVLATICILIFTSWKSQKVDDGFSVSKSNKVLLVGIDPKKLDFTKITFVTEEELTKALETEKKKLITAGYDAEWCLVDLGATAQNTLKDKLAGNKYNLVLIGAGIRTLPDNFILFENLINVIHQNAPSAQIGFNTNQNDTEISVKRRLKL